jgi:hypothetical protein
MNSKLLYIFDSRSEKVLHQHQQLLIRVWAKSWIPERRVVASEEDNGVHLSHSGSQLSEPLRRGPHVCLGEESELLHKTHLLEGR